MKEVIVDILSIVVVTSIGTISSYIIIYLKNLIDRLKQEKGILLNRQSYEIEKQKHEMYKEAICHLDMLVEKTVCAIEQETGEETKYQVKYKGLPRSMLEDLKSQATRRIKENLKPEFESHLRKNINNLENYINIAIENQVYKLKTNLK